MTPLEKFVAFLEIRSSRDSEDIHDYQFSTDDCRIILEYLIIGMENAEEIEP